MLQTLLILGGYAGLIGLLILNGYWHVSLRWLIPAIIFVELVVSWKRRDRDGASPRDRGKMIRLIALTALAIYGWIANATDRTTDSPEVELVDYTVVCSVPYESGVCRGSVRPGTVTQYRIDPGHGEVTVLAPNAGVDFKKLVNCKITDARNWK